MINWIRAWPLVDAIAFALKLAMVQFFFAPLEKRDEAIWCWAGRACLLVLAGLYVPQSGLMENYNDRLLAQMERMLLHWVAVFFYLLLEKGLSCKKSLYWSGFYTVGYLAAFNFWLIACTVGIEFNSASKGRSYTVLLVYLCELCIALAVHWAVKFDLPGHIGQIRAILLGAFLVLEVYFKWFMLMLLKVDSSGWERGMALFAWFAAMGIFSVLVLVEANLQAVEGKEKEAAEITRLRYEAQSAKRALQTNNDIRRLYHDMKNHLLTLQNMAGSEGEVQAYLEQLLPQFEGYETQVMTGNAVVDGLLSEKIQRASLDRIRFNIKLDLRETDWIRSVDLVTVFGNAVDNCIEAVQQIAEDEERCVFIKGRSANGTLALRFENPYVGKITLRDKKLVTGKQDLELHGIGISSIQSVVQRYNGALHTKFKDTGNWFILSVVLRRE